MTNVVLSVTTVGKDFAADRLVELLVLGQIILKLVGTV